jgi:hypothetical protein
MYKTIRTNYGILGSVVVDALTSNFIPPFSTILGHTSKHVGNHLELGRQWKVIVFHMYFVVRRVRIFNTKNLYGNDT